MAATEVFVYLPALYLFVLLLRLYIYVVERIVSLILFKVLPPNSLVR